MSPIIALAVAAAIGTALPAQVAAQAVAPTYADIATLTLASPVIVRANVVKAERLSGENAVGVAAGRARMLVRVRTTAALLAPDAVPAEFEYLYEQPLDARGKVPKLRAAPVLLFLRPSDRPGQFTLVSAAAQLPDRPDTEATVRGVLSEARAGVPRVTGITSAFRVPGSVPGEAESQFFLATVDKRPISLVVLSRQGQERTLSLALGDVIDEAAAGVKRDTLLWYRLACFLPRTLPDTVGGDDRAGLADDWAFVLASLGNCERRL